MLYFGGMQKICKTLDSKSHCKLYADLNGPFQEELEDDSTESNLDGGDQGHEESVGNKLHKKLG